MSFRAPRWCRNSRSGRAGSRTDCRSLKGSGCRARYRCSSTNLKSRNTAYPGRRRSRTPRCCIHLRAEHRRCRWPRTRLRRSSRRRRRYCPRSKPDPPHRSLGRRCCPRPPCHRCRRDRCLTTRRCPSHRRRCSDFPPIRLMMRTGCWPCRPGRRRHWRAGHPIRRLRRAARLTRIACRHMVARSEEPRRRDHAQPVASSCSNSLSRRLGENQRTVNDGAGGPRRPTRRMASLRITCDVAEGVRGRAAPTLNGDQGLSPAMVYFELGPSCRYRSRVDGRWPTHAARPCTGQRKRKNHDESY
jgi:hypothetical protein